MTEKKFSESLGFEDETVYHYCSIEAMHGIFSNKSFWLTFLESSNDLMELRLGEKIILKALSELKTEYPEEKHLEIFNKIELAPKDKVYNKHKPHYKYYGLSFVQDKDSLTHWERYANNASGVSIGLNISLIKNFFMVYGLPEIVSDWLQGTPIIYSYEKQIQYAKSSIISKINGLYQGYKRFNKQDSVDLNKIEHIYSVIYYTTLSTLKPMFKHNGFANEKEYRVYLKDGDAEATAKYMKEISDGPFAEDKELLKNVSNNITELATKLRILSRDIRYGVFNNGIRSYYALNLEEIWSDTLIPEVVLGPKCYQNKKELKSFIKSCDLYKTKVNVSKIPIR